MRGKAKPRCVQASTASISKRATPFYTGQRGLRHQSTHHGLDLGGLEFEGTLRCIPRILKEAAQMGDTLGTSPLYHPKWVKLLILMEENGRTSW